MPLLFDVALDVDPPIADLGAQWERPDQSGSARLGQRSHALEEPATEGVDLLGLGIAGRRERESQRQNPFGLEAHVDAPERDEAAKHQPGADEEDHRESHLGHHQSSPKPLSRGARAGPRAERRRRSGRRRKWELAVRQIISRAVASEGVMDIFAAAGLDKPDISVLSDEFLAEVRDMPHRNLAVELLQKLLKGELSARRRKNLVQARSFAEMLEHSLRRYQNRAIEAAQVIEELIQLAKALREANARGERLGLSEEELAFYDALETNDSAVQVLGDDTLRDIARELVETVRRNVTIDWTLREDVRAFLRSRVRRILRKHGYPAGQAGEGHPDGAGTGRAPVGRLGDGLKHKGSFTSSLSQARDAAKTRNLQ